MRSGREIEGEGLGLMISRQLAALNFSDLTIRSRQGSGTDILFETPLTSPAAVATSFAKFRSAICGPKSRPQAANGTSGTGNHESDQANQADVTSQQSNDSTWSEARLGLAGPGPRRIDRLAVGVVSVGAACAVAHADEFDRFLQHALGRFELAYRTSRRSWVWVLDADDHTVMNRREQIDAFVRQSIDAVRLQWGEAAVVPVQHRTLQNLLIDRMTTRTLAGAVGNAGGMATGVDQDEVRLGTQPIEASPVAASRLDDELRRLGGRMNRQSQRLQAQASSLRPRNP